MDDKDEKLRTQLIEAILEYFEGNRTLRSVLALGITAHDRNSPLMDSKFMKIISQLNTMGNEIANGKNISRENIKETFTAMLENLTRA